MSRRTTPRQTQVQSSHDVDDTLTLGYTDKETLEYDLNYIRSVIRDLKGTTNYDSPLTKRLEELAYDLSQISLHNAVLTGVSISETPPLGDNSPRIATTEFVTTALTSTGTVDKHFTYEQQTTAKIWRIEHNMNKYPAVVLVDNSGGNMEGRVVYIDQNNIEVHLTQALTGQAFLN